MEHTPPALQGGPGAACMAASGSLHQVEAMVARERPTDERSATAKAELEAIVARRPDLKGKSLEAIRRILRRETRMSLRPLISLIANSQTTATRD